MFMQGAKAGVDVRWGASLGLAVALAVGGCRTAGPVKFAEEDSPEPDARVVLAAGDVIEVKFLYAPELNEVQAIRPDGRVTLQLVGDVEAAGKEPGELQAEVKKRYAGVVDRAEVAVIVRELDHRAVYVAGAVQRPGRVLMPGDLTALDAIMQAGGFDPVTARVGGVLVIREEDGRREGVRLDFRKVLAGELHEPYYLHARDIVYVPRTRIVNVNQWIAQHISGLIPQFGFTYFRTKDDTQYGLDTSR